MGVGPAAAIPVALQKAGLNINDIDIFEINEAFASQATYCAKKLGFFYIKYISFFMEMIDHIKIYINSLKNH
jgi:acetyl-CoA acetyltransferase